MLVCRDLWLAWNQEEQTQLFQLLLFDRSGNSFQQSYIVGILITGGDCWRHFMPGCSPCSLASFLVPTHSTFPQTCVTLDKALCGAVPIFTTISFSSPAATACVTGVWLTRTLCFLGLTPFSLKKEGLKPKRYTYPCSRRMLPDPHSTPEPLCLFM